MLTAQLAHAATNGSMLAGAATAERAHVDRYALLSRCFHGRCWPRRHPWRRAFARVRVPDRRQSGHGQDDPRPAISDRGLGPGGARPLHHHVGDRGGASTGRGIAWLVSRRPGEDCRDRAAGKPPGSQSGTDAALFVRPRAWRDHAPDLFSHRANESGSNCRGQPVRVPPVGAEFAALSATDPRAQAFLRSATYHRPAPR